MLQTIPISRLPMESLIAIFALQPSLSDAHSLSGTCRSFQEIGGPHSYFMLETILRRQFISYDDAKRLVEGQNRANLLADLHTACGTDLSSPEIYTHPLTAGIGPYTLSRKIRGEETADSGSFSYHGPEDLADAPKCTPGKSNVRPYDSLLGGGYGASQLTVSWSWRLLLFASIVGLPHERERAIETIYFCQSFLLAHSEPSHRREHEAEIMNMSVFKRYSL